MHAFFGYVLRRIALVAIVLGTGLFGWPGDTGAQQSLLNSGSIDASGARRISVTPSKSAEETPKPGVLGEAAKTDGGSFADRAGKMFGSLKARLGGGGEEPPAVGGADGGSAEVDTAVAANALKDEMTASGRGEQAMMKALDQMAGVPEGTPSFEDLDENSGIVEKIQVIHSERDKAMARAAAFGAMMQEMDEAEGEKARAARVKQVAEKANRPPTLGERLFAEFGAPERDRTPYEISHAALAAQ